MKPIAAAPAGRSRTPLLTDEARAGFAAPAFRWAVAPALLAWLALGLLSLGDRPLHLCLAPRADMLAGLAAQVRAGFALAEPLRWSGEWALMLAAMMLPLVVPMIGHVAGRSLAGRRERSVFLFVLGYLGVWSLAALLATIALVTGRAGLASTGLSGVGALIGCALAAAWQISAAKQRALNRCHGIVPLRAFGAAADRDALGFGLLHGSRCIRACLPMMVPPLLGQHGLVAMAVLFTILLGERARHEPQLRLSALVLLLLGLASLG